MTTRIESNGFRDVTVITADEGKVFRRKLDGFIFGRELWLGLRDSAYSYEEIDDPRPEPEEAEDAETDLA